MRRLLEYGYTHPEWRLVPHARVIRWVILCVMIVLFAATAQSAPRLQDEGSDLAEIAGLEGETDCDFAVPRGRTASAHSGDHRLRLRDSEGDTDPPSDDLYAIAPEGGMSADGRVLPAKTLTWSGARSKSAPMAAGKIFTARGPPSGNSLRRFPPATYLPRSSLSA